MNAAARNGVDLVPDLADHPFRATGNQRVGVVRADGEYQLVAVKPINAGERLFQLEGVVRPFPSRFSVQIGIDQHIDVGDGYSLEEIMDRYFWRFMNHGCDPSTLIRGVDVVARRDLVPWEPVTFNYNTTELELATPFACHCASPHCLGMIRGYRHLTDLQRGRLPSVAAHLVSSLPRSASRPTPAAPA